MPPRVEVSPPEIHGGAIAAADVPAPTPAEIPSPYASADRWRRTPMPCWGLRGTAPEDFVVEVDSRAHTTGDSSASLASIRDTAGWGTLYQFASATNLRGKRIEFTADVRTAGVRRGAYLFVRVDDGQGQAIAMDNMWSSVSEEHRDGRWVNRAITGDTDWTTQRVVLDIPGDAAAISYGIALDGPGKVWIDNAVLELTTTETLTTGHQWPEHLLRSTPAFHPGNVADTPKNLDFEVEPRNSGCG
jgi:hypothetical protein